MAMTISIRSFGIKAAKTNSSEQVQEIQRLRVEGGASAIMTALVNAKIVPENMPAVNRLFDYSSHGGSIGNC
ncbi:MAG: hypothetical protein CM15mP8_2400 [Methanobacteriota archaeon]|nr:MAG: hypothetical protein CM15mP8_2400 [Euryarchaeota archaeon]